MSWTLLTGWLLTSALAGRCEAEQAALKEAAPPATARAFLALAACNPSTAKLAATGAFEKMIGGAEAPDALVAAIEVEAGDAARAWLDRQEPDVRSRAIARLGGACDEHPAVGAFFVQAQAAKGDAFFVERWHRGLSDCRTDGVRALLSAAMDNPEIGSASRNRTQFHSLLEVYARNLQAAAVPRLAELLAVAKDEPEAVQLVATFPDAAGVGGPTGTNAEAAAAAIQALVAAAPTLPQKAVGAARTAVTSLGDEATADSLAKYYWRDRYVDGEYTYGLYVIEDITCKNASKRAVLHHARVTEGGDRWPEQLEAAAASHARSSWKLQADKCKGTSELTIALSPEPLADADAYDGWLRGVAEEFASRFGDAKRELIQAADVSL